MSGRHRLADEPRRAVLAPLAVAAETALIATLAAVVGTGVLAPAAAPSVAAASILGAVALVVAYRTRTQFVALTRRDAP